MKCGKLNFLEPSGSLHACNGTALPFTATAITKNDNVASISKGELKSTDKILSHYVNASNLMTLSVM
jgi:hypothetical protein